MWHNIVGYRKDLTLRVYVDGVEDVGVTNNARSTLEAGYDISNTVYNACIGAIWSNDPSRTLYKWFVGVIDDVAIWDRALTEDEIDYLWNAGEGNPALIPEEEPEFVNGVINLGIDLQNYPNPFSGSTNISFNLNNSGMVNMKVFNVLGQEVATLINDFKTAGNHEIVWNAAQMANGMYFVQLTAGTETQTIRILLKR